MFSVHCPTHGTDVLLSERRISRIESVDGGHRLHWRCWCGTEGTTAVARVEAPPLVGRRYRPAV